MEKNFKISVQLFGRFRDLSASNVLELWAEEKTSVAELKLQLARTFQKALLEISVLANETRVLAEDELVGSHRSFALLPPVCGG